MKLVAEKDPAPVGWAEWVVKIEGKETVVARFYVIDPMESAEGRAKLFAAAPEMRVLVEAAASGEEIGVRAATLLERL